MAIPAYIMEEHKEAFYCWQYMKEAGQIPVTGSMLLHVDAYDDFAPCEIRDPLFTDTLNLEQAKKICYEQLNVLNYIVPAFYYRTFRDAIWLSGVHDVKTPAEFLIELESPRKINVRMDGGNTFPANGVTVGTYIGGTMVNFPTLFAGRSIVLDIDLCFFCPNPVVHIGHKIDIEITENAYRQYADNPYHFLRLKKDDIRLITRNGHYYFSIGKCKEETLPITNRQEILGRMDSFFMWLKKNKVTPSAIDISRSRYSHGLSKDVFPWVEEEILKRLKELYELDIIFRPEAGV